MNVTALYFSPTGGSKRSALSLAAALAPEGFAELDITCGAVAGDFGPGDIVVFSVPCYNGRVPEVAAGRLEQVHGHRTPCIISITYGNRDYDDSLLELQDIVQRQGFIREPPLRAAAAGSQAGRSCLARGAGHQGAASVPGRGQGRGLRAADLRGLYGLRPVRLPVPCAGHRGRPSQHRRHALPFLLPLHPQLPCGGQAHGCGKLPRFRAGFQPAPEGSAGERIHLLEEARKRADAERGGIPPLFFYRGQPPTFLQGGRDSSGRGQ